MDFRFRVKQLREERGLSQKALSTIMGVGQSTVAGWESTNKMPAYRVILKLADYFNVSLDYLLGRSDDPSPPKMSKEEMEYWEERANKEAKPVSNEEFHEMLSPEMKRAIIEFLKMNQEQKNTE